MGSTSNVTFVENLGTLTRRLAVDESVGERPAQQVFFGEFQATGRAAVEEQDLSQGPGKP